VGESRDHFRQVDRLFDAALDLEPNERDEYLDEACGPDRALRSRVRTLLDAHERSAGFLKAPAVELAAVLLEEPPTSTQAPERAGPFRIVRELGHGGMGVVYLAEREGGEFQQRVALKLVRHFGAGDAVLRRFLEERRILALLEHPRIAHLVDGGVTSDGLPYFAMELVDGEPIDTYCDTRRFSIDQRIDLFIEVCDAVQYAHEHLVIHRDLKPSNILVRGDGQLKLLDFGIAKLLDPLVSPDDGATQTGVIALTPEYAAPEQVRGQPVSTATDTYALGVLIYRLLTGLRPYEVRGRTPAELERIICEVEPPRPSLTLGSAASDPDDATRASARGTTPEKLRRQLRGDLDVIILKALHKDPARRYASAAALRDDLERYRSGRPVLARPDSPAYRFGKFVRRNRTAAAASVITLAALVGATAFSTAQMREAQRQRDAALLDNERQSAITEVQMILASDTRGSDGQRLSAVDRIAMAERFVARRFASNPRLTTELLLELATRLVDLGDREGERAILARARTVATRADLPAQLARIHCEAAYTLIYDDFLDSAHARLAEAVSLLRRPGARTDAIEAVCLQSEGELLIAEGHPDSAVRILTRALANTRGAGNNPLLRQEVMMSLAAALRAVGRTRDATDYQRLTLAELEAIGYGPTDIFANVVSTLTSALFELGEMTAVDSVVSLVIRNQMAQGAHSSGVLYSLAGIASLRKGELDSAAARFERARRDTTEGAGGLISYLAPATTQLHLERGHPAEARESLSRLPSGTLIRRVNRAWFTAWTRYLEGDVRGATRMLEDSLHAIKGDAPKPPPSLAMPFVTAAEWRLDAGDARAADSLARLGRDAAAVDSLALDRSAYVGRAELVRARALVALGTMTDARRAAERAAIAMSNGYGPRNARTLTAVALRDSLASAATR
jgi:serine/threonine-protein kinase